MKRIAVILTSALAISLGSLQAGPELWNAGVKWVGIISPLEDGEVQPRGGGIFLEKVIYKNVDRMWGANVVLGGDFYYAYTVAVGNPRTTKEGLNEKIHAVTAKFMLGCDLYGNKEGRAFLHNMTPTLCWTPNVTFGDTLGDTTFGVIGIGAKWRLPWKFLFEIEGGKQQVVNRGYVKASLGWNLLGLL